MIETNDKSRISTLNFTKDQSKAYDALIEWIEKPFDSRDYKRALIGPAGTGKTYLVRSLISNCKISYSKIGLAAPTHKATRVLRNSIGNVACSVKTLQSDLGLRLNLNSDKFDVNNPPFDPKGTVKIGNFKFYIVDEASMVSQSLQTLLERFCLQNEVKLLEMGDASQLPPVGEYYSSAFRGVKTYALREIVRQDDDNPVKNLLNLLRHDIEARSFTFLEYISKHRYETDEGNTKGFYVCNKREFEQAVINNFRDEQFTSNIDLARIVAYTNVCVNAWNTFVRQVIVKDSNKSILTKNDLLLSYVTIVDEFLSPVITNSEEYIIKDIINYVHPKYEIKGFMVTFVSIHGGINSKPLFVVNHSDTYSVNKYFIILNQLIDKGKKYGGSAWKEYFEFKNDVLLLTNILKQDKTIIAGRDLDYGFALTSHRSQGSTFDNVLVDVNDIVFDKLGNPYTDASEINRRLYVACSRCRNKLYLNYGR